MAKPSPDLIIHLEKEPLSMMGLISHQYRIAACGARAERWLTTANTEWSDIKYVNCKRCKKTKFYKEKLVKS